MSSSLYCLEIIDLCTFALFFFLYMLVRLEMIHAVFVIAFTGGAVSEFHLDVVILGHSADLACMDCAFR